MLVNSVAKVSRVSSGIVLAGACLTTLGLSFPAQAFSLVTNRANLNGDDLLDWSVLGAIPTPPGFRVLPGPITANSQNGLGVAVTIPAAAPGSGITPPLLFQTTAAGIPTNFASGDFVLFTGLLPGRFPAPGNPGPLTLRFSSPVAGVGAQIAVDDELTFMATVAAYDAQDNLLGSFSVPGTSSLALDNSAIFLGGLSDQVNISRLVFSSSVPDRAIGINALSINRATPIPEPGSLAGLTLAGISLLLAKMPTRKAAGLGVNASSGSSSGSNLE